MTGEEVVVLWALPAAIVCVVAVVGAGMDTSTALRLPGAVLGRDAARRARTAWVVAVLAPVWPVLVVPLVVWAVRKGRWLWAELDDIADRGKR